jgi:hypothetical protein
MWMTVLLVIGVLALWIAQQKGWIKAGSSTGNTTTPRETRGTEGTPARSGSAGSSRSASEQAEEDGSSSTARERASKPAVASDKIDDLFRDKKDKVWVEGDGEVKRLLSDDDDPPRHQRFLLELSDKHEVMVVHNIDDAPRADVKKGDRIRFRGEYIWTDQGGKVHFTHKPKYGSFNGGWIEVGGRKYE